MHNTINNTEPEINKGDKVIRAKEWNEYNEWNEQYEWNE